MPAYDKEFMADVPPLDGPVHLDPDFVAADNNDEDQAVPVEVKLVVWVKRQAWNKEYGVAEEDQGDFEEGIQDWVRDEMMEYGVNGGNWSNVTSVTL